MLWAMTRRTPTLAAARIKLRMPSMRWRALRASGHHFLRVRIARQVGQLVDDHLGPGGLQGLRHGVCVEGVKHDRLHPGIGKRLCLSAERVVPVTGCPAARNSGSRRRPITPGCAGNEDFQT
jgi:hypothetical protein